MAWRPYQKMALVRATEDAGSTHSDNFLVKGASVMLLAQTWTPQGVPAWPLDAGWPFPGGLFRLLGFCEPADKATHLTFTGIRELSEGITLISDA